MAQITLREVPALVAARKPFRGNSLTASQHTPGTDEPFAPFSRLNAIEDAQFYDDKRRMVYVVWSYGTPIAWVLDDGTTYKVSQKFSVTTSRHMGCLYTL